MTDHNVLRTDYPFIVRVGSGVLYNTPEGTMREYAPLGTFKRDGAGNAVPLNDEWQPVWDLALDRFVAQARAVAALDHPNVVPIRKVHDGRDEGGTGAWLITGSASALERVTLDSVIQSNKVLAPHAVAGLAKQLSSALTAIHDADLVHLDICPQTLRLSGRNILLSNFATDDRPFMRLCGTQSPFVRPGYSAMEQYDGSVTEPLGPATDIYCASALLYRLANGIAPPDWRQRSTSPLTWRENAIANYPASFIDAINKGLSVEPADRFANATEWLAALDLGFPSKPTRPSPSPSPSPSPHEEGLSRSYRLLRRIRRIMPGLAFGAVLAVAMALALTQTDWFLPSENIQTPTYQVDSPPASSDPADRKSNAPPTPPTVAASPTPTASAPTPTLIGNWRLESEECGGPRSITGGPIQAGASISSVTVAGVPPFNQRILTVEGNMIRTRVIGGPSDGREFVFRLEDDGKQLVQEGEIWFRCAN